MADRITVADAANRYANAGWPVHPLHDTTAGHCSCTAGPECGAPGKHPRTRHGFQDATHNPATVTAWWRRWPTANIGVPTGPASRLAVIDLDGAAAIASWRQLTAEHGNVTTATADTPHGRHLWYRLPTGVHVPRSIRGLGDGIDVLGDHGYAIAPPSAITACPKPHSDDATCRPAYVWTPYTRQVVELPAWIPELTAQRTMTNACHDGVGTATGAVGYCVAARADSVHRQRAETPADGTQVRHPRQYALAALRGEADRLALTQPGRRNDTLYLAACRLQPHIALGVLTEQEVRDRLHDAARQSGLAADDGQRSVERAITSALTRSTVRAATIADYADFE